MRRRSQSLSAVPRISSLRHGYLGHPPPSCPPDGSYLSESNGDRSQPNTNAVLAVEAEGKARFQSERLAVAFATRKPGHCMARRCSATST